MNQNEFLPEKILIPFFGKNSYIIGCELGTLGASGTVAMLNRMPSLQLYTIDPFQHFSGHEYEAENPQEYHDNNFEHAKNRLKEFGDRVRLIRMTSDEASYYINELVDFVWVDGDHREIQVRRDIINYKSKLKQRSIFGGHDWWLPHIQKVVHEQFKDKEIHLGEDGTWWIIYE